MYDDLQIIEDFLADLFMPAFAKSVIDKQLKDLGMNRNTYNKEDLDRLLKQIETKVLVSFQGDRAPLLTQQLKKKIKG